MTVYLYTDSESKGEETFELVLDADGADIADAVNAKRKSRLALTESRVAARGSGWRG